MPSTRRRSCERVGLWRSDPGGAGSTAYRPVASLPGSEEPHRLTRPLTSQEVRNSRIYFAVVILLVIGGLAYDLVGSPNYVNTFAPVGLVLGTIVAAMNTPGDQATS